MDIVVFFGLSVIHRLKKGASTIQENNHVEVGTIIIQNY